MRTALVVTLPAILATQTLAATPDWGKVDQALGRAGSNQPGEVHKYGLPRSDLHVTVDGVPVKPAFALGGWLAFKPMGEQAMVMGDLVLTEQEINPVLSKLLASGITVTAIHNHLLRTARNVLHARCRGGQSGQARGDPARGTVSERDADGFRDCPSGRSRGATVAGTRHSTARGNAWLQGKRQRWCLSIWHSARRYDHGCRQAIPPAMGTAIAINFQPTGGGKAAITGDFVLEANEVEPVLAALRGAGIEVTALHNHMLDDQPHTYFVHFWANDDAIKLAQGLRAALDHVNVAKS